MWTENEIQGLKSQEAKDLAIELLQQLQEKECGPISPGEVQLQELQYELKLKEAEAEDTRLQEAHQLQVKQLQREQDLQLAQRRNPTDASAHRTGTPTHHHGCGGGESSRTKHHRAKRPTVRKAFFASCRNGIILELNT
jgi:hypothetical protein